MNINFTSEELSKFATDLSEWHAKKTMFVLENFIRQSDGFRFSGDARPETLLARIADEFDKNNPKPDWRSLL